MNYKKNFIFPAYAEKNPSIFSATLKFKKTRYLDYKKQMRTFYKFNKKNLDIRAI